MTCGYFFSAYYNDVIPRTRTLVCFGFLLIGYILRNRIRAFKGNIWLTFLSVIILIVGMLFHDIPNIMQCQIPTNPLLFYGCAFAGFYVVLVVSRKLESYNRISAPLQYVGRNTLYVFGLHWPLIGCIKYWMSDIPSYIVNSLIFVIVIGFSLLFGKSLHKIMPALLPEIK